MKTDSKSSPLVSKVSGFKSFSCSAGGFKDPITDTWFPTAAFHIKDGDNVLACSTGTDSVQSAARIAQVLSQIKLLTASRTFNPDQQAAVWGLLVREIGKQTMGSHPWSGLRSDDEVTFPDPRHESRKCDEKRTVDLKPKWKHDPDHGSYYRMFSARDESTHLIRPDVLRKKVLKVIDLAKSGSTGVYPLSAAQIESSSGFEVNVLRDDREDTLAAMILRAFVKWTDDMGKDPIRLNGPDPFIVWDNSSSRYYFTTTTAIDLQITSASTLDGLRANPDRRLVYQDERMKANRTTWAPELHNSDGKWYLYFSLELRPWVLEGGANPFDPYPGPPIQLSQDWGIDGTVLNLDSTSYFVWSCQRNVSHVPAYNQTYQSLCISELITPTQIDSSAIGVISQPTADWEIAGFPVNEGPQALYWANQTYLMFSASFCGTGNYALGLLTYNGGNPLEAASWTKTSTPVFSSANGNYGTGHNGLFTSPDGTELWNVFHAVQNPEGRCDETRATFVQQINRTSFNTARPDFGTVGYYGIILDGPSGEQEHPETINDVLPGNCSACWTNK